LAGASLPREGRAWNTSCGEAASSPAAWPNSSTRGWRASTHCAKQFGFRFVGAWVVEASDEFVWILGYEGPDGFAAADARYYASAERGAVRPDPAHLIAASDHRMIRSVFPEAG